MSDFRKKPSLAVTRRKDARRDLRILLLSVAFILEMLAGSLSKAGERYKLALLFRFLEGP